VRCTKKLALLQVLLEEIRGGGHARKMANDA